MDRTNGYRGKSDLYYRGILLIKLYNLYSISPRIFSGIKKNLWKNFKNIIYNIRLDLNFFENINIIRDK